MLKIEREREGEDGEGQEEAVLVKARGNFGVKNERHSEAERARVVCESVCS